MPPDGLSQLSFLGGLLAGFASSLHCVGMCGGIAASLSVSLGGELMTAPPSKDHCRANSR